MLASTSVNEWISIPNDIAYCLEPWIKQWLSTVNLFGFF